MALFCVFAHFAALGMPNVASLSDFVGSLPAFDRNVSGVMELVLEDLFGAAAEAKEAEGVIRGIVKEAKG